MTNNKIVNRDLPSIETIEAATTGDVCAINAILQHYKGYILALSSRPCIDPFGNVHMAVDPEMKRRLETKLITRILKFKVAWPTKKCACFPLSTRTFLAFFCPPVKAHGKRCAFTG